jgi:hypothetical protein
MKQAKQHAVSKQEHLNPLLKLLDKQFQKQAGHNCRT